MFDELYARGRVREGLSDAAWLRAMLDVEAALARALAAAGVIPAESAAAITSAASSLRLDPGVVGRAAAESGTPVLSVVGALRGAVTERFTGDVHRGATSQDIVDTALMLLARRALAVVLDDLHATSHRTAELADEHRRTVMPARTLLQQAVPTTFGLKAAGWTVGLDAAAKRLAEIATDGLAVQLGGAGGTLASLGNAGPAVLRAFAVELELPEPISPWHTERTRVANLGGALGTAASAIAKVALDIVLLAQTEVAEVRDERRELGASSAMPHKRNPVPAVAALASARQAPGLVAVLLSATVHEHERAAGGWQAEWQAAPSLLLAAGSAAAWLREAVEHLEIDAARMRANLEAGGGLPTSEAAVVGFSARLGHRRAQEVVGRAAGTAAETSRTLAEVLADDPDVAAAGIDREAIGAALDPTLYLGSAETFIDRVLRDRDPRHVGPP